MFLNKFIYFLVFLTIGFATTVNSSVLDNALRPLFQQYPGKSGIYVLEKGEESLLARAWLANNAQRTIDVQYFIWSTDNIGILAAESLLRAAERGVKVRVLVDDLLVDAPGDMMVALALHNNIAIKIYNPRHSVGVPFWKRIYNVLFHFRSANQRMHDKTFIVDGKAAITGGRNMADEYFDYNHTYNFRDRDALLLGPVVEDIQKSFDTFWNADVSQNVEDLLKIKEKLGDEERHEVYAFLHKYAENPENLEPEVAASIQNIPQTFPELATRLVWEDIAFIADLPGKNNSEGLGGGGRATSELVRRLEQATTTVTIQSPYLVLPEEGFQLFRELRDRGVTIKIVTNSLASTDNLQAFSGYSKQRSEILATGVEVFEYKPEPAIQRELIDRFKRIEKAVPTFAIHAKTMVIDGEQLFIGTFNLDPRSANLNTEVGVFINNLNLAQQVEQAIFQDMQPENSWNANEEDADAHAPWKKRLKVFFWKLLPLDALL
ncbi:MAG: phospholipase D family protein [Desulfocapsaceae bacterium]|nr:phospholipase D family protein [Desulfocapsaceae bacterium]